MSISISDALLALEAADPAVGVPRTSDAGLAAAWSHFEDVSTDAIILDIAPIRQVSRLRRAALVAACVAAVVATAVAVVAVRGSRTSSQPASPLPSAAYPTTPAQAMAEAERRLPAIPLPTGAYRVGGGNTQPSFACAQSEQCAVVGANWVAPLPITAAIAFYKSVWGSGKGASPGRVVVLGGTAGNGSVSQETLGLEPPLNATGEAQFRFVSVELDQVVGGTEIALSEEVVWFPPRSAQEKITDVSSVALSGMTTGGDQSAPVARRTLTGSAARKFADAVNSYRVWTGTHSKLCAIDTVFPTVKAVVTTPTSTLTLTGNDQCVSVVVHETESGRITYPPNLYGSFADLVNAGLKSK